MLNHAPLHNGGTLVYTDLLYLFSMGGYPKQPRIQTNPRIKKKNFDERIHVA